MPIDTGGGGGFMSRMRQQAPGMINAAAQNYGDPRLRGMNRATGQAMSSGQGFFGKKKPAPTNPDVQGMQTTMQNGPNGMPPTGPSTTGGSAGMIMPGEGGMVRGPSMPRIIGPGGGMPPVDFGGGMFGPGRNTGITGGMFGGGGPVMRPQVMPPIAMAENNMGGPGLWNAYNQLSQEQGVPRSRQLFY